MIPDCDSEGCDLCREERPGKLCTSLNAARADRRLRTWYTVVFRGYYSELAGNVEVHGEDTFTRVAALCGWGHEAVARVVFRWLDKRKGVVKLPAFEYLHQLKPKQVEPFLSRPYARV